MSLWRGERVDDLEARLPRLEASLTPDRALNVPRRALLEACGRLAGELVERKLNLDAVLEGSPWPVGDLHAALAEIAEFLAPENLQAKLDRELGPHDPWYPGRVAYDRSIFEVCAPLGLLVHIAPTNALGVGFLSLIEGLLAGNLNFVKLGGSEPPVALELASRLVSLSGGALAPFVYMARIPSARRDLLTQVLACADGVAAWGGEEAIAGVRELTPRGARLVEWGHKLSFAYVTLERSYESEVLEGLARDVCLLEQQACSSPQAVYLDTADPQELETFATHLAAALERVSPTVPQRRPTPVEWGEITAVRELCRLEQALGVTKVWEAPDRSWRVLMDTRRHLTPSPLYRTLWVKPLPQGQIVATLRPLRGWLQTAAMACTRDQVADLTRLLVAAGVTRITEVGGMLGSYPGEPHDGEYALQRYTRRVGLQLGSELAGISNLASLSPTPPGLPAAVPVMTKADFQARAVDDRYAHLYFHSGGSSGEPKLSVFTYADYEYQMGRAAEGLYAAGLDPTRDRCMNLFYAGQLYGGFISFFSVLQHLRAVQFPMAAVGDHEEVAKDLVHLRVNTLMGMPSYLMELFRREHERLKAYGGVTKIFFGGEHFSPSQRRWLTEEFGVQVIRSAVYGAVDAGPLAYQCPHCEGTVHHLLSQLESLEILETDRDEPVAPGQPGRLVFTSLHRHGQDLTRYDLGDLGRWVDGLCPCGRRDPRFELLGRHGDVFRTGTNFFNYRTFVRLLSGELNYSGAVQVELLEDRLLLRLEEGADAGDARQMLLDNYAELLESVVTEGVLDFQVVTGGFLHTSTGKLREVVDRRSR